MKRSKNYFYFILFRNPFYFSSENDNKNSIETSDNIKLYEDFVERALIVEKDSYVKDPENLKLYFLKQVNYNNRGVIKE